EQRRLHRVDARRRLRGARHAVDTVGEHRDRVRDSRHRPRRPAAGSPRSHGVSAAGLTVAAERATTVVADLRDLVRRLAPDPELYAESARVLPVLSVAAAIFVALFPLFGSTIWILRLEQGLYFGLLALSLNILVG